MRYVEEDIRSMLEVEGFHIVYNFGSINIDDYYFVSEIVRPGQTIQSARSVRYLGGKGLNQSVAIHNAGEAVNHIGFINENDRFILDRMIALGLDTSAIEFSSLMSGRAFIQVDEQGENSIVIDAGANAAFTEQFIDRKLDAIEQGHLILVQNEVSHVDYILRQAKSKGFMTCLNFAPANDTHSRIDLNFVDYLIVNEEEASALSGCEAYEDALVYFKKYFPSMKTVVTLGSKGAIYADRDMEYFQSSFKVNAIDTTGAGDTFVGYFISSVVKNGDVKWALKLAACAAALTTTKEGTSESIPVLNDVLLRINNDAS